MVGHSDLMYARLIAYSSKDRDIIDLYGYPVWNVDINSSKYGGCSISTSWSIIASLRSRVTPKYSVQSRARKTVRNPDLIARKYRIILLFPGPAVFPCSSACT